PSGGTITMTIGWTSTGGQYISVKDTGPGIPEDEIPIVLSSFGQGSIAIKDAEQGTGLGLTIVQSLLFMHQGRFDLKSKLRQGTEAVAYLPKERVSIRNRPEDAQAESATNKDNPAHQALVA
ncbi:MAG: ATP-binding protein, partial [Pseudomonadota bacterium]